MSSQLLTHQDCRVHDAVAYLYTLSYGQPMLSQELSTMIREGEISRRDALHRLEQETRTRDLSRESLRVLCDTSGLTPVEVLTAARKVRRKAKILKAALTLKHAVLPRAPLPIPLRG